MKTSRFWQLSLVGINRVTYLLKNTILLQTVRDLLNQITHDSLNITLITIEGFSQLSKTPPKQQLENLQVSRLLESIITYLCSSCRAIKRRLEYKSDCFALNIAKIVIRFI